MPAPHAGRSGIPLLAGHSPVLGTLLGTCTHCSFHLCNSPKKQVLALSYFVDVERPAAQLSAQGSWLQSAPPQCLLLLCPLPR